MLDHNCHINLHSWMFSYNCDRYIASLEMKQVVTLHLHSFTLRSTRWYGAPDGHCQAQLCRVCIQGVGAVWLPSLTESSRTAQQVGAQAQQVCSSSLLVKVKRWG